ncbi:MAG: hypothetical protein IT464_03170 [Planctomycetes bacterium]|nr:hypothetical protein [Planctomycetota bacterium]
MPPLDIGLATGHRAVVVADGLRNPSFVSFKPGSGEPTVCDSGNGRVLLITGNGPRALIDDMATEFWKVLEDGRKLYQVGPMAAVWQDQETLVVSDSGHPDGKESLLWVKPGSNDGEPGAVTARSNTIAPTTDDAADKGEGNLTGFCRDGTTLYVCCHGNDKRTWVAVADLKTRQIKATFSADEHGIATNSPMQARLWRGGLLVLYSGAGGVDDGLLVHWDLASGKPQQQWILPGLSDPMGLAQIPGSTDEFVVTDNAWALGKVNDGKLARVNLGSDRAQVAVIANRVPGPVNCDFGPDGELYVTCLGTEIDTDKGLLLRVSGIEAHDR